MKYNMTVRKKISCFIKKCALVRENKLYTNPCGDQFGYSIFETKKNTNGFIVLKILYEKYISTSKHINQYKYSVLLGKPCEK